MQTAQNLGSDNFTLETRVTPLVIPSKLTPTNKGHYQPKKIEVDGGVMFRQFACMNFHVKRERFFG
jgi:hypothetical protein